MAFIAVWLVYPMIQALVISLHDWNPMPGQPSPFVGLAHYVEAANDPLFWSALKNTVLYTLVTVAGQMLLGILVALMLDKIRRGQVIFRVLYYLPVVTSWVVVSLLFRYLFNSSPAGFINYLLVDILHLLSAPVPWLTEANTAWVAIDTLGIWKGIGWTMVIILAALQTLPEECYSAASIDGASGIQSLFYITLPLLMPTIILVLIMLTIGGFQAYIQIALITGGGPLHRTDVLLSYMYNLAFTDLDYGYSTAISFILAAIVFAISQAQLRLQRPADITA
jgi:multiple sugar transport system permease protein